MRLALIAPLLLLSIGEAHADPPILHIESVFYHPHTTGELGDEMAAGAVGLRTLLGVRAGAVDIGALLQMNTFRSHVPERDNDGLFGLAFGVEARLFTPGERRWEPFVGGGWRYHWMVGSLPVTRTCDQTGACDGGFWTETPSYSAHGLGLAAGLQRTIRTRCGGYLGVFAELRGERLFLDLPGTPDVGGALVTFTAGGTFGSRLRRGCR